MNYNQGNERIAQIVRNCSASILLFETLVLFRKIYLHFCLFDESLCRQRGTDMSFDLLLKPSCGGCGSTTDLYGSSCKHMTLCLTCGKTMAENRAKCYDCGVNVTRLIRVRSLPLLLRSVSFFERRNLDIHIEFCVIFRCLKSYRSIMFGRIQAVTRTSLSVDLQLVCQTFRRRRVRRTNGVSLKKDCKDAN